MFGKDNESLKRKNNLPYPETDNNSKRRSLNSNFYNKNNTNQINTSNNNSQLNRM
jgi:hypothetical protein